MLRAMLLAALALALVVIYFYLRRSSGERSKEDVRETTPAVDAWLRDALEHELAEGALGLKSSTPEERRPLARTLADEPDADVVATIEEKVRAVELEFLRYPHEDDIEATVRVRYENGKVGQARRRLAPSDIPEAVRADFTSKGATRVFRTWSFPWQRVRAL
jgi:hypothetical protein